jgi:oligopeptidase B
MSLPPIAKKVPFKLVQHDHERIDEYHWMRLTEEQRNADGDPHTKEVVDHLNAENAHTEAVLAPVKELREKLFEEMKGRIKQDDISAPFRENGYWYRHRFETGKEYAIHERRKDKQGADWELLLDENAMAEGHEYFDLGSYEPSPDNNILAYTIDTVGRRKFSIHFRDLRTGEELDDDIKEGSSGCAWADNRTVFYARKDETLRSSMIYRHVLGESGEDKLVYEETDEEFNCYVYRSRSDKYVIIGTASTLTNEYHLLPVTNPIGQFEPFLPREEGHEYGIDHADNEWYISTNWNARNFRLMKCPENARSKENWVEVIPHRPAIRLEDVEVFKNHLAVTERSNGLTQLRIIRLSDFTGHYIEFNDPAYVCYGGTNAEYDSTKFRYGYTSMTTPASVYLHDMDSQETELLKEQEVLGEFDRRNYRSQRLMIPARDGSLIPCSLVHHKDTALNGSAPYLQYGYGSYGHTVDPTFSIARLSLLDRGFVFAIAHIRGGEIMGRHWYENGRMEHKLNTFTDFVDVADHIKNQKLVDASRMFCMGGSAGGLLVGAVANLRPDLFKAVVAEVPFVDVVTTMLDTTIPLTTGEFNEWGNPADKEAYERMLSYSPYDNIKEEDYPSFLVTTGLHDSQVQYWEPAKWVARLREKTTGNAPVLLHTNMEAGHGGASGRFERLKEVAMLWAYLLWQAGDA